MPKKTNIDYLSLMQNASLINQTRTPISLAPDFDRDDGNVFLTKPVIYIMGLHGLDYTTQTVTDVTAALRKLVAPFVTIMQTESLLKLTADQECLLMALEIKQDIDIYPDGQVWSFFVGYGLRMVENQWQVLGDDDSVLGSFETYHKAVHLAGSLELAKDKKSKPRS